MNLKQEIPILVNLLTKENTVNMNLRIKSKWDTQVVVLEIIFYLKFIINIHENYLYNIYNTKKLQ